MSHHRQRTRQHWASVAERPIALPPVTREIVVSQIYSRYHSRDFERRWQKRLNTPTRSLDGGASELHVAVTHRFRPANRYGWELRPVMGLSVQESRVQFASWEEASQAGKLALKALSKREIK